MIEWQKFTQAEKDVPSYIMFLEFLDLRAKTTELTSFDANQRNFQANSKKPKFYSPGNFSKTESAHATTHTNQVFSLEWSETQYSLLPNLQREIPFGEAFLCV